VVRGLLRATVIDFSAGAAEVAEVVFEAVGLLVAGVVDEEQDIKTIEMITRVPKNVSNTFLFILSSLYY